jgi:DnaJ-class molecular chaperone
VRASDTSHQFKEIAIAYQTLSDPVLRKKYNEFGPKESAPEGGYMDPGQSTPPSLVANAELTMEYGHRGDIRYYIWR